MCFAPLLTPRSTIVSNSIATAVLSGISNSSVVFLLTLVGCRSFSSPAHKGSEVGNYHGNSCHGNSLPTRDNEPSSAQHRSLSHRTHPPVCPLYELSTVHTVMMSLPLAPVHVQSYTVKYAVSESTSSQAIACNSAICTISRTGNRHSLPDSCDSGFC